MAASTRGSNQATLRRIMAGQPTGASGGAVVRRACACGSGGPSVDEAEPAAGPSAIQRKCACGGEPGPDGECAACKAKRLAREAQGREGGAAAPAKAPPIVHSVIGSPGRPLDAKTRADLEPKFGQDFSGVRVHTDARAAESARAVNAVAYTVGNDIVFGAGRYDPDSSEGRHLLAHELTHTIQQGAVRPSGDLPIGDTDTAEERDAAATSRQIGSLPAQAPAPAAGAAPAGASVSRSELQREGDDGQPGAAAPDSAAQGQKHDDGIGLDEVHAHLEKIHGPNWLELLSGTGGAGEQQAQSAADTATAGGQPDVARMPAAPELQRVAPAIIIAGAVLAAFICAYGFFSYAMDNFKGKSDKWKHCWCSCKIGLWCGGSPVFTLLIGAGKEGADWICDKRGGDCRAEWADFLADLNGVGCVYSLSSCSDCCSEKYS